MATRDPLLPTLRRLRAGPGRAPPVWPAGSPWSLERPAASAGVWVEGLAARGIAVGGIARDEERLKAAMTEVAESTGARTLAVAADVTDRAAVDTAVARVAAELGRVDLLVNNAGRGRRRRGADLGGRPGSVVGRRRRPRPRRAATGAARSCRGAGRAGTGGW